MTDKQFFNPLLSLYTSIRNPVRTQDVPLDHLVSLSRDVDGPLVAATRQAAKFYGNDQSRYDAAKHLLPSVVVAVASERRLSASWTPANATATGLTRA